MGATLRFRNLCLLVAAIAPVSGQADDPPAPSAPAANNSQYTLFNPVPDNQLSTFCTDRPTRSNLPCTVDAGHFVYEADGFNWTYDRNDNITRNTYLYTNPTFKIGITDRLDMEATIAPLVEVTTHDSSTHASSDLTGPGDLYVRAKYNLYGGNTGDISLTLLPYVKIPTAPPGIGDKAVEEGAIVPVSFNLPQGFVLLFDPEVDRFKNANDDGYHSNYQGLVNISHPLFTDSVTAYAELWGDNDRDPSGTVEQTSADFAVSWLTQPNLQFDIGANIGLNRNTADVQSYVGISQRF